MATFLGTWNPLNWSWEEHGYAAEIARTASGEIVSDTWSLNIRRSGVSIGDRCFILRQGSDMRGIVASGTFTSEIYIGPHYSGEDREQAMAEIDFDTILAPEDRLPVEDLKATIPGVIWDRLQGSGVQVDPRYEEELEQLWADHCGSVACHSPEEEFAQQYAEGRPMQVWVNRYERSPIARRACIAHHGTTCLVCGLNFEVMYGPKGKDFIHVHHLDPLGSLAKAHMVDPIRDLRPVCPNCHSMLHTSSPPIEIPVLKQDVIARRKSP